MKAIIRALFVVVVAGIAAGPIVLAFGLGTVERIPVGLPEVGVSLLLTAMCLAIYARSGCGTQVSLGAAIALGLGGGVLIAIAMTLALNLKQVSDFNDYVHSARWLADRRSSGLGELLTWRPPGMTISLAVPMMLGLSDAGAVIVLNALCAALVGYCLHRIFRDHRIQHQRALLLTAAIAAGSAPLLLIAASELPALALIVASLTLIPIHLDEWPQVSISRFVAAGVLIAISALFRPITMLQVVVMAAFAGTEVGRRVQFRRQISVRAGALISGTILGLTPWTIRNLGAVHAFVPISTNGGEIFYSANISPDWRQQGRELIERNYELRRLAPNDAERNLEGFKLGAANIARHPGAFLLSLPWRAAQMLGRAILWPAGTLSHGVENGSKHAVYLGVAIVSMATGWIFGSGWWSMRANVAHLASSWPAASFAIIFASSLLFACAGRYVLTLLPYAIVLMARPIGVPRTSVPEVINAAS